MFRPDRDYIKTAGVGAFDDADLERMVHGTVRHGRVTAVDYGEEGVKPPRVRVGIGDPEDSDGYIVTGWLPMKGARSDEWNPLRVGEAVTVYSESGELQNGVVEASVIYNTDNLPPGDTGTLWRKRFSDGAVLEYDTSTGDMAFTGISKVSLAVGGSSITVDGDTITLSAGGSSITFTGGALKHDGVNVGKTHKHGGVQAGGAISGVPQ